MIKIEVCLHELIFNHNECWLSCETAHPNAYQDAAALLMDNYQHCANIIAICRLTRRHRPAIKSGVLYAFLSHIYIKTEQHTNACFIISLILQFVRLSICAPLNLQLVVIFYNKL